MKKAIFYSSLGGVLEFYDFIIFAIFASEISHVFFPSESQVAGLLMTFTVFAMGYLIRPLGGIIFGHFGDKYGRKKVFTYSIIIMAVSTFLIACVPSYAAIGVTAPILLTLLRLLQGASIGGEIPGAITFISETAPKNRTLACALVFFGLVLGIILGELLSTLLRHTLTPEALLSYGWRIAFIIGGVFGIWGFYLRRKLVETELYKKIAQRKVKVPLLSVLKKHPRAVFSGWALLGLDAGGIMALFLIMPAYSKLTHIPKSDVFIINTLILFIVMIASLVFGWLGDKINKRFILSIATIISIALCYTVFQKLSAGHLSFTLYTLFCIFTFGVFVSTVPAILAESFPTEIRYSGVGLVYNLSFATTGGLAPMIIFYLISKTNNLLMPALYLIAVCLIALLGLIFYPKNYLENKS